LEVMKKKKVVLRKEVMKRGDEEGE
jgi:hypothetical protein